MNTRVDYPYLYFHSEPNLVFVYKIETDQYVSISNVNDCGEWSTFELNHSFEQFNHYDQQPLEGRGYFMNLEDLHQVVQEINEHIQNERQSRELAHPYHLVSSESTAGTVRFSLKSPKTVIGYPDDLAIGPLWKLNEETGQAARIEWLNDHINYELDDYELEEKVLNTLREIEDIPTQVPIYIWYADHVNEQISMRYFVNLLRNKANDMILIKSSDIHYTSNMEPDVLQSIFDENKDNRPLSNGERLQLQMEWNNLTGNKEMLRLWKKNEIIHVAEDYFDKEILNMLIKLHAEQEQRDYIIAATLLAAVFEEFEDKVSLFYLEYRLRHLIYNGQLAFKGIPRSMRHYSVKVR
ncbi:DUF1835 domain-containing protein [Robertmurraya massiliosenegalensis]|uniref:DUF1835 domain-containing protein n=1 Tax=Robertmurraya TaxID=2837507 RepID=UPI0039A707B0